MQDTRSGGLVVVGGEGVRLPINLAIRIYKFDRTVSFQNLLAVAAPALSDLLIAQAYCIPNCRVDLQTCMYTKFFILY